MLAYFRICILRKHAVRCLLHYPNKDKIVMLIKQSHAPLKNEQNKKREDASVIAKVGPSVTAQSGQCVIHATVVPGCGNKANVRDRE